MDVTACSLSEPVDALAGERFNDAIPAISAATDSLELQLEELGAVDNGSNFKDNLKNNNWFNIISYHRNEIKQIHTCIGHLLRIFVILLYI